MDTAAASLVPAARNAKCRHQSPAASGNAQGGRQGSPHQTGQLNEVVVVRDGSNGGGGVGAISKDDTNSNGKVKTRRKKGSPPQQTRRLPTREMDEIDMSAECAELCDCDPMCRLVSVITLPIAGQMLYVSSLIGGNAGDPEEWLQSNLPLLIILVFFSSVLFTAAIIFASWEKNISRCCGMLGWCAFCMTSVLFWTNHDSTVERHGAYNLLGFCCFLAPQLLFVVCIRTCITQSCQLRCKWPSLLIILIAGFWMLLAMGRSNDHWTDGLFGKKLELIHEGCTIHQPSISWDQLYEDTVTKAYSVWAWRPCPLNKNFSFLDARSGTVTINCPDANAQYETLPDLQGQLGLYMVRYVQDKTTVTNYTAPFVMPTEAVVAICGSHRQLHITVQPKQSAIDRVHAWRNHSYNTSIPFSSVSAVSGDVQGNVSYLEPIKYPPAPNIVFIFLDAISRAGWHRKFPETLSVLQDLHTRNEDLEVFQFLRYHAVGHTTRKNARAMFTGESDANRHKTLWELIEHKYVTGIVDNTCTEWSAKYLYDRSAIADHRLNSPWCLPEYVGTGRTENFDLLRGPWSLQRRCITGIFVHDWVLQYAQLFLKSYQDQPKFLLVKFTEGHEPSGSVLGMLDNSIAAFVRSLDLNETAVFLVSDHGLHMGPLWSMNAASTRLENKLPGWFMILPKWWTTARNASSTLRGNEQSLVTPYNIYATVLDVASEHVDPHFGKHVDSAFRPIPFRNCTEARIPQKFCKCKNF
ncbi:type I phosphodiesterase/nucleotide pyrophosphatase [Pelomyxa schiedti]|nr:type I phosphodiesterase/nucleotide pyrophosphatase [Pelomyxa schiedti]